MNGLDAAFLDDWGVRTMRIGLLIGLVMLVGGVACTTVNESRCGGESEPCCAATVEESLALPRPASFSAAQGRCDTGAACAQMACAPHSTCENGTYNGTTDVTFPSFCAPATH